MGKHFDGGNSGSFSFERRSFLGAVGAALGGLLSWRLGGEQTASAAGLPPGTPKEVTIVEFTNSGERKDKVEVEFVKKTDAEWKKQLSADSYEVTRHDGTERAFTGALLNIHDKGVFRCICCDTALFSSATKFESGTGWPSFWAPIAKENIVESTDISIGMRRTSVACRRCDAHLGHVFDDGPKPTGLRYCMNSVSLKFAKAA